MVHPIKEIQYFNQFIFGRSFLISAWTKNTEIQLVADQPEIQGTRNNLVSSNNRLSENVHVPEFPTFRSDTNYKI